MLKANTVWNAAAMSTLPTQSTKTRQNRPSKHLRRRPKRSSVVAPVLVISAPMATVIAGVAITIGAFVAVGGTTAFDAVAGGYSGTIYV